MSAQPVPPGTHACKGLYNSNMNHCCLPIQCHWEKGTTFELSSVTGDLQWYHSEAPFI